MHAGCNTWRPPSTLTTCMDGPLCMTAHESGSIYLPPEEHQASLVSVPEASPYSRRRTDATNIDSTASTEDKIGWVHPGMPAYELTSPVRLDCALSEQDR